MFCPQCGFQNNDNAQNCSNCGAPLNGFQQDPTQRISEKTAQGDGFQQNSQPGGYQQNQQSYQQATQPNGYQQTQQASPQPEQYAYQQGGTYSSAMPPQQSNGKAVGALVCGICAIVFSGTVIIGVVLGIIAIVLAGSALKEGTDGKAKAGRICGIIGLALSVVTLIVSLIFGVTIFSYVMSEANSSKPAIVSTSKSTSSSSKSSKSSSSSTKSSNSSSSSTSSKSASSSSKTSSSSASSSAAASAPESQASPSNVIVGTWAGVAQSGESVTVEFTSSGTYKVSYDGGTSDIGNYEFDGTKLDIYMAFYQSHATVSFPDNDTMLLKNSIGDTETYHRK